MEKAGKLRKRISAWLLTLVMVAGLIAVPASVVQAATTVTGANATNSGQPVYVSFDLDSGSSTSSYNQYNVSVHNNSGNAICDWSVTVQFSGNPGWDAGWNGVSYDSASKTMTIQTYGESSWNNATIYNGQTGSGAGFQVKSGVLNSASVTITYTSGESTQGPATGSASSGGSTSGGTTSGTTASGTSLQYALTGQTKTVAAADTPVGKHGKLSLASVSGYAAPIIVDKNGTPFQLRGASTHGMHWGEMAPYVNKGAFQSLRDEWGVNMVRLVSYVTQGGYTQGSQNTLDSAIQTGVQAATDLGMYAIIDWHIHAENPWDTESAAETFFAKYAQLYKNNNNVIYEICNEPTGVSWYDGSGRDLYSYCKKIATIIRQYDKDALIVCGTNNWSQDVDDVAKRPLKNDGFTNILYTFHFYSGSHYDDLMNKVKAATAAGTPVFVTEFGICDASGNGGYDTANADKWIALCDQYNISYACWSLCNKNESASYLLPGCTKTTGGWIASDLSTTGIWLVNTYRAHQDKENGTNTKVNGGQSSSGSTTSGGSSSASGSTTSSGSSGSGMTGGSSGTVSTANLKKKVSGVKLTAGKRKLTLKWKKKKGISGYQIQISTSKKFKKKTTYTVSAKSTKKVLTKYRGKKLQAKKKYYVRIRAYVKTKNAKGKVIKKYSKWTTVSKKTK